MAEKPGCEVCTMNAMEQTHEVLKASPHVTMNAAGEVTGLGASWACRRYGAYGHNYLTSRVCVANFMSRNDDQVAA